MTYQATVPNGSYIVNLKFADGVETAAGQRVFSIAINGKTVAPRFDIVGLSGGTYQPFDKAFPVTVTNGRIQVSFGSIVFNPKVNAIEILPGTIPPPTLKSISTTTASRGKSIALTFTGTNFLSDVVVNAGPGTTLTNVKVVSSTQITATLSVASSAATGTRKVTVTTPGGVTAAASLSIH
jgi:hypothetical protein